MVIETFPRGTGSRWGSTLGRRRESLAGGSHGVARHRPAAAMETRETRDQLIARNPLHNWQLKSPMKGPLGRE